MWLFTNFGFFSIVQKPGEGDLTIRSRVVEDLDELRGRYLPELSPTIRNAGTDYPFRGTVSRSAFAKAAGKIVRDIDYANFKDEVLEKLGADREAPLHEVWNVMDQLKETYR